MKKLFTLFLSIFLINTLLAQTSYLIPTGTEKNEGFVSSMSGVLPCQPFIVQLNTQLLSHPIEDTIYTKVCPADLVTFGAEAVFLNNNVNYLQTQSNTKFIWTLDNMAPDTTPIIHKTFFQPMIKNYTLKAIDVNGCQSSNVFKGVIMVSGTPIISLNSNLNATINTPLFVDAGTASNSTLLFQPVDIETDFLTLNFFNYDTVIIPDGSSMSYFDDIFVGSFEENQYLETIDQLKSINLNMEHSYLGDVSIRITCPSGQDALLKSYNVGSPFMTGTVSNACSTGGGSINLGCAIDLGTSSPCYLSQGEGWDYQFKPGATGCFGSGGPTILYLYVDACGDTIIAPSLFPSVPNSYTNTPTTPVVYGSYQNLSSLIGCPLNGNWRITVTDHVTVDNGYIFNWGIEFDESLQIDSMSYTITVDSARWTGQNITPTGPFNATILNNNPGISNYTVTLIDEFGCEYVAPFTINTTVSIENFSDETSSIKVYPNPTNGVVSITNDFEPIKLIQLYSINGLLLYEKSLNEYNQTLDLSLYQSGVYICKVTSSNGEIKQVKIIKK